MLLSTLHYFFFLNKKKTEMRHQFKLNTGKIENHHMVETSNGFVVYSKRCHGETTGVAGEEMGTHLPLDGRTVAIAAGASHEMATVCRRASQVQ